MCSICDIPCVSKYGLCRSTEECRSAYRRTYYNYELKYEYTPCSMCGTKTRSCLGICKTNPECVTAHAAAYRLANQDKILAREAAYRLANPQGHVIKNANRRARKRDAYVADVSRSEIYERDDGLCHVCMKPVDDPKWPMEHVVPLSRKGTHEPDNCAVSCRPCNSTKYQKVGSLRPERLIAALGAYARFHGEPFIEPVYALWLDPLTSVEPSVILVL